MTFLFATILGFGQNKDIKKLHIELANISDSFRYTDALNNLATQYYESNADSLLLYTIKARDISRRLKYAEGEADAANNLGILEEIKGNAQQAFRYYADAYNRYSTMGNRPDMRQSAMNIALVYYEMENPAKSLVYFRKAFALNYDVAQDSVTAILYANYVNCFFNRLPHDSINYFLTKAREIAALHSNKTTTIFIDQLSADDWVKQHDTAKGVSLLQASLQSALQDSLFYSATNILVDLGNTVSDSAKAAAYYFQSLRLAEAKGFRATARYVYEQLYDFYQAKNDDAATLLYAQKLLDFNYAQKNIDNAFGIDYIDYAAMNQNLAASLQSSRYQKRMLWLITSVGILFLVLVILLLRNRRKMKRTAMALNTQFKQSKLTMESLDRTNKSYIRVIKVVAHDLRNPLSSISMISEMIDPYNMSADEIEKLLSVMKTTSKSCFGLIEELLNTEMEREVKLDKKETGLDEILMQSMNLLSFKAKEKEQQIVLTNKHHLTLFVDDVKIIRALNNLVMNAIKFSHEGSTIHIKTFTAANNIVITVEDNGIGIPETMVNRLFDPFTPAKRKGTKGENTFGLGLYITKQIVEAHNGNIWFKSEPGRGTTFYVELPVKSNRSSFNFSEISESEEKG